LIALQLNCSFEPIVDTLARGEPIAGSPAPVGTPGSEGFDLVLRVLADGRELETARRFVRDELSVGAELADMCSAACHDPTSVGRS
jgi:hypothetical protein